MVKQKCSRVLSVFIALFLIFSIVAPVSVFADDIEDNNGFKTGISVGLEGDLDDGDVKAAFGIVNDKLGTSEKTGGGSPEDTLYIKVKGNRTAIMKVDKDGILINKSAWSNAKDKDITKAMRLFVDALGQQDCSKDALQSFMNNLQESDTSVGSVMLPLIFESTKGDMYQAYKITSPFLEILSIVLGVGAVILILLLLFSTVMDLAYIGLPVWREAQASKDGGNKNPFGVSYEALTTVKEVEKGLGGGDGGYRNAYLLYFKRRALTYIILAICIFYLICGGLSGIIGFVLSLVSGITG